MMQSKEVFYKYFYGSCIGLLIFILVFTFNFVGIYYMYRIIISLILILFFGWSVKRLFKTWIAKENKKINTKVNPQLIPGIIIFGIWFFIDHYLGYLSVYFHEVGHTLTALNFNVRIKGIFLSTFHGLTFFNPKDIETLSIMQYTIIAAA
ncbi:MAG: hypothetical protein P8Y70_10455, partial [Candidatus Lokiarchaeota archaeon]